MLNSLLRKGTNFSLRQTDLITFLLGTPKALLLLLLLLFFFFGGGGRGEGSKWGLVLAPRSSLNFARIFEQAPDRLLAADRLIATQAEAIQLLIADI